ncbi:class I SAM-dependent methyltransferase [Sphingomonas qilianensis]|uniref:Methyltransferase domain-containing protein n=1 Tax=Sphingomonas qilianensis TaxID=1736690 RepID=A0ABU9XNM4_9SPHN
MTEAAPIVDYGFHNEAVSHTHAYLYPAVKAALHAHAGGRKLFELGCGNGSMAADLAALGYHVAGVDPAASGIAIARANFPQCQLEIGSTEEDLVARFGQFDVLVSLEVAEHVFSPHRYAEAIAELLIPGGIAILSTPYHSYLKNLAMAATGKLDNHFTALWEGGHIKFWSRSTLGTLMARAGFEEIRFDRVGRIPALAKSMVATYRKKGD